MAAFAVLYFTMMNDLGVFDVIVSFITRRIGNHIYPVLVATFFVSIASHWTGRRLPPFSSPSPRCTRFSKS